MTFDKLEEIRQAKGLRQWQFAWLLDLRPKGEVNTPIKRFCGSLYQDLKTGRRNIGVEIIASAERIEAMTANEVLAELAKIQEKEL